MMPELESNEKTQYCSYLKAVGRRQIQFDIYQRSDAMGRREERQKKEETKEMVEGGEVR